MPMEQIDENSFSPKAPRQSITDILEKGVLLTMEDDLQKAESGQYRLKKLEPEKIEQIKRIAQERSKLGAEFRKKQLQEILEREEQRTIEEFQREEREQEVETEELPWQKEEIKEEKEVPSLTPKIDQIPLTVEKEPPVVKELPEKLEKKEAPLEQELKEREVIEQIRRKAQERAEIEQRERERKMREEQEIVKQIRQEAKRRSEIKHKEERKRKEREKEQRLEQKIKEIEKLKEKESEKEKKNILEGEKRELQQKLRVFPQKIKAILEKKSEAKIQKQEIISKLNQILQRESEVERAKEALELQEKKAPLQEKHKIEKKRWKVEEQLEKIEKEKWDLQDELKIKEQEIEKLNEELKELTSKKEQLEQKIREINDKLAIIKFKKEKRIVLEEKLPHLRREKIRSEGRLVDSWKEFQKTKKELEDIKTKETQIEAQEKEIIDKEKATEEPLAKRELEKQRWQVSRERKEIEKERWQKEEDFRTIKQTLEKGYREYKVLLQEERALQNKLWKINTILEHGLKEGERLIAEKEKQGSFPLTETEREAPELFDKERQEIIQEIRSYFEPQAKKVSPPVSPEQKVSPPVSPGTLEEKVIVSQIREAARKKELEEREKRIKEEEREKLIEEKPEKETKEEPKEPLSKEQLFERLITPSPKEQELRKEFLERVALEKTKNLAVATLTEKEAGENSIVFQPVVVVKKASLPQKLLIRILFILLGVGLIAGIVFGLKGFVFKKKAGFYSPPSQLPSTSLSTTTGQALSTTTETTEKIISSTSSVPTTTMATSTVPVPASRASSTSTTSSQEDLLERKEIPPESLLPVTKNREIRFSSFADFTSLLEQLEKERPSDSQFQQLLVQNISGHYLNLKEFLDIFGSEIKEDFWQLTGTSTIFIYYSKEGFSGLGFVSYVSDREKLQNFMKEWEQTIAQDLDNFLFVVAGQELKYSSYFKTAHYQGIPFRYLDVVNKNNFGICYTFWRDYFLFTTSGETMIALLKNFNQQ